MKLVLPLKTAFHKTLRKNNAKNFKKTIDPAREFDRLSFPANNRGDGAVWDFKSWPLSWFKRSRMADFVSGIIRRPVLSFGWKTKKTDSGWIVVGWCESVIWMADRLRNRALQNLLIFEHFTGTGKRNTTVSRARHPGGDNQSKNPINLGYSE